MPSTSIDLKDAGQHFATKIPNAIHKGAMKGLLSAAQKLVQEITTKTIPAATPSPMARGVYRAGWTARKTRDGAEVENVVPYAAVIEYGARPSNVKPGGLMIKGLADWVKVKGIASDDAHALRLAHAIAQTLKKRGIFARGKGLRIMEKARKRLPKFIEAEVKREVERALRSP